jgi:hypothetical protein
MKIFSWLKNNLIKVVVLLALGAVVAFLVPQIGKAAKTLADKIPLGDKSQTPQA